MSLDAANDFEQAVEAIKKHTEGYAVNPQFRANWLGFTEISRNLRAQQIRAFGTLMSSVARSLAGWRVLDVGCGDGRWLRAFLDYDALPEDLVGVDVSDARFAIGSMKNPAVKLVKTDGTSIPFASGHFDLVTQFVCFSSIPTQALRQRTAEEIKRVLKRGGYVFWWDLPHSVAPADPSAKIDVDDYFDWPIRKLRVSEHPNPGDGLRPFPGGRVARKLLNCLAYPPTHMAALIGPKP